MSDAPERRIATAGGSDPGGTIRFAVVSLCVLGTLCAYAACIVVVLRGSVDALFGLVPWLAGAALLGCAFVTISAVVGASRERIKRRHPGLTAARLAELAAHVGARASADREHAIELLSRRLEATRAALVQTTAPAVRQQLTAGGFSSRVERELVTSRNKWHRVSAAGVLGLIGSESSLAALQQSIADPDADVAYAAAQALARYSSPAAYDAVLDALTGHAIAPARVAALLESFRCPFARELIELRARSDDSQMRYWAAYLLGSLGDARSAPVIEWLAQDPSQDVRANAAEALASFADTGLIGRLLDDESWVVRSHAAKAAEASCQSSLAPQLAKLLEDRSWWVRQNATLALASFGAPAVPALLEQLHSTDRFARNKAAEALIRNGYAREQLERLRDGSKGSRKARQFLIEMGRAEALRTIETAALTSGPEMRKRLLSVLRAVDTEEADAVLRRLESRER